ncbi:MAG TPA: type I secretion system permease/ATPase [Methylomusa anaerophila]|uniref:Toxin RTX-I translocation ATP-binding protein n=1 Tax=Methylomusa anaerophila TaxID=1930071 RepID=A0A348AKQ4_9FIRM|nr:type I secretion system permease/ATPase [Methylomusa anaerophila]BBB91652.1 toxin RTX-I translocation ATP-binding protein [Methylomusa anaerophila]HML88614.1 type I secretion system permease/ATPase [Methylomusa anaerophila]
MTDTSQQPLESGQNQARRGKPDTGLACLVTAARILGIPADQEQMRRAYVTGSGGMDTLTMLRAAKDLSLKARQARPPQDIFFRLPFPAIVRLNNGNYAVVVRTDGSNVLVIDPCRPQPFAIPAENFFRVWEGEMIFLTRRFSLPAKAKKFGISWFLPIVIQYRKFFIQVLFLSFILQLFGLVSPLFTQIIIDKVLVHRGLGTLDVLVLGMSVMAVFQAWMTGLRAYLFTHTTNKIDVVLSSQLFRHIMALPLKYFETWQVGDVVSRVRELDHIRQFITGSSLTLVLDIIFAVVYVAVMFTYSSLLSIIALLALPVFIILNLIVSPLFRRLLNERFLIGAENQSFLIETVTGMQTVKAMAVEPQLVQKYEQILARYVKAVFSSTNLANVAGNIGTFIQQFFNLAILWVGAHTVMDGKMSVGQLIAFQMLAGQVTAPVMRLVNMWQYFQQTMVSVDRVGDIMNETAEPAFNPSRTTLPAIRGEIVLDRVTFRYRQDTSEVLHQVSLHIKPGMRVGIVGRSGSGKSTLTKLVQRLYVPESGRVLIDGVDLFQVEPAWLRRQIGVVLQENYLFSGSVGDNIAQADQSASPEAIMRAAEIAGAREFIARHPAGYDMPVGERGSLLSGGQRQRIAIARALLTNPKILIFDEATSALDYESERIIMENLDRIAEGRTMVLIAHRLSTVRNCDKIVVLERGKIVEQGTHEELMQRQGYYYRMYQQQER